MQKAVEQHEGFFSAQVPGTISVLDYWNPMRDRAKVGWTFGFKNFLPLSLGFWGWPQRLFKKQGWKGRQEAI